MYLYTILWGSKCYHSLVVLTMGTESSSDMASKEQGWNVLTEVLEILDTRPKVVHVPVVYMYMYEHCYHFTHFFSKS